MNADRMHALEKAAAGFGPDNHPHFIQEALQVLRDRSVEPDDAPVAALRLLVALQGSAFAGRDLQKAALHDVGAWLEAWLMQRPGITRAELAHDLAWLARLARVSPRGAGDDRRAARPGRGRGDRTGGQGQTLRRFGASLERIVAERRAQSAGAACDTVPEPTAAPPAAVDRTAVDVSTAIERIEKGNAAQAVPVLLAALPADARRTAAQAIVQKLSAKWLKARVRGKADWASTLLELAR